MSDSKKQSTTIKGDDNEVTQDIKTIHQSATEIHNHHNTYITQDTNKIDNKERTRLLIKIEEFEQSLADFKKSLQEPQISGTNP